MLGCARSEPPPAPTPIPQPPPLAYYKDGATTEEFQRTRAGCIVSAEMAQSANRNPYSSAWSIVFSNCMRAAGWVLRKQTN